MRWVAQLLLAFAIFIFAAGPAYAATKAPLVLAAARVQESLTAAARAWAAQGHLQPVLSFAASSALARQIEAGAPADLFISADKGWMDYLQRRHLLKPGSRVSFLGNELVLISALPEAARPRFST